LSRSGKAGAPRLGLKTVISVLVRALSLCLVVLLFVAIVHKGRVLRARSAAREPLIQLSPWRRRHAMALLLLALGLETAIAAVLLASPDIGYLAFAILTIGYAVDLRRLPDEPCNCFGSLLRTTSRHSSIIRNVSLSVISATGAALYLSGAIEREPLSQETLGIGLVLLSLVASIELLQRLPRAPRPGPEMRAIGR